MTESWEQIICRVSDSIENARKEGRSLWFRGQRNSQWKVRSTLHRHLLDFFDAAQMKLEDISLAKQRELLRNQFKSSYQEFVTNIWDLLRQEERSRWGLIFAMQHHGISTRLLDCSQSFACAIYFAQYGRNKNDDAAIFLVHPEKLNNNNPLVGGPHLVSLSDEAPDDESAARTELYHPAVKFKGIDYDKLPSLPPMAVNPSITNTRMRAQQGTFILAGDSFDPIEEQTPDAFEKIVLPSDLFEEIEKWLRLIGIRHFVYFPDLEGLSTDLMRKRDAAADIAKEFIEKSHIPPNGC